MEQLAVGFEKRLSPFGPVVEESVGRRSKQGRRRRRRRHSDTLNWSFEEYRDMVGWEGTRQTHAHIDTGTSICTHTGDNEVHTVNLYKQ